MEPADEPSARHVTHYEDMLRVVKREEENEVPYISKTQRKELDALLSGGHALYLEKPGELNYVLTKAVIAYLERKRLSYQSITEVIGVLETMKLELYRRLAVPYERRKHLENGDVFPAGLREQAYEGEGHA